MWLLSPMLKDLTGQVLFLPFYHFTLLQNSQSTNYEAGNQMSKPLKTASKIHTPVLGLRGLWSFLCKKYMSFATYNL